MSVVSIGVDVGGTKTAAALVTRDGQVLHERIARSTAEGVEAAVSLTEALAADATSKGFELTGLGAGFPEYVEALGRLTSREVLDWRVQPADAFAARRNRLGADPRHGRAHHRGRARRRGSPS